MAKILKLLCKLGRGCRQANGETRCTDEHSKAFPMLAAAAMHTGSAHSMFVSTAKLRE
jgi:hypothetical protein